MNFFEVIQNILFPPKQVEIKREPRIISTAYPNGTVKIHNLKSK
jgi:hypothetical protein